MSGRVSFSRSQMFYSDVLLLPLVLVVVAGFAVCHAGVYWCAHKLQYRSSVLLSPPTSIGCSAVERWWVKLLLLISLSRCAC
jgi:hypothetical protein